MTNRQTNKYLVVKHCPTNSGGGEKIAKRSKQPTDLFVFTFSNV